MSEALQGFDGSHDFAHIERVCANCARLCKAEGLQPEDCRVAMLAASLHDVDDKKYGGDESLPNAQAIMKRLGLSPDIIERVCSVVQRVSFSGEKLRAAAGESTGVDAVTACVQDADRLDAIGAWGIARVFCYGGSKLRPLSESIDHFHDKLLLLKDLMKSPSGKREAQERHVIMVDFLAQLKREASP